MSDYDPSDRRPPRPGNAPRERMSADYDDDRPRRATVEREPRGALDIDLWTRRLVYAAAGIGALLLAAVGGWTLLTGHRGGIPVLGPPPGPVRVKPVDPGGMQLAAGDGSTPDMTGHGEAHLAPGPEQPDPSALARHYGAAPAKPDAQAQQVPQTAPPAAPQTSPPPAQETTPDVSPQAGTPTPKAQPAPASVKPVARPTPPVTRPAHPVQTSQPQPRPPNQAQVSPAPPAGTHMVQLAALDTAEQARAEWARLQHRAPDLLSGRAPVIQPVERAGHTLYRLRVSGFADVPATHAFCAKLRAEQVACTPAVF